MSIQTVLCAVDISNAKGEDKVLKRAARLAELEGAQLDVITVVPDYGMSVVGAFFDEEHHEKVVEDTKAALSDLITAALGVEANAKVRHVVATGSAYEQILKTAEADGADLIVIGAHKPDFKD
jgi:nucleotide-binding universal stress UspA family protein